MLGIIINPKSGKRAFRAQRIYLFRLLRNRQLAFEYHVTRYPNHAKEIARKLVEDGLRTILVLGGDGTLSETVNGVMKASVTDEQRSAVQIGLMPRGTGNDWGRYWGLNRNHKQSLARFFEGEPVPIDAGCITSLRNGEEHRHYFINSVGYGIDAATCAKAEKMKPYIGSHSVNYVFGLFFALLTHKSTRMHVRADGQTVVNGRVFTMNIGNGPYSGGGIRQNPDADPRDGVFHAMLVCPPTWKQVLMTLPKLFNGRLTELPFVRSFTAHTVDIETKDHLLYEADGILGHCTGGCTVRCMHKAFAFRVKQD